MSTRRIAVIGKLKPGSHERAVQIIGQGPPYELGQAGLERHSVFLASDTVVFVFEGPDVEEHVRRLVDDPAISAGFGAWGPLLEGSPQLGHEHYHWTAERP